MTEGGKRGASLCAIVSMDNTSGTGEGGQEGGACAAVPMVHAAVMIGEGCQEEYLSSSQDNLSSMVAPSDRGVKGEQVTQVWSSFGLRSSSSIFCVVSVMYICVLTILYRTKYRITIMLITTLSII